MTFGTPTSMRGLRLWWAWILRVFADWLDPRDLYTIRITRHGCTHTYVDCHEQKP